MNGKRVHVRGICIMNTTVGGSAKYVPRLKNFFGKLSTNPLLAILRFDKDFFDVEKTPPAQWRKPNNSLIELRIIHFNQMNQPTRDGVR